MIPEFDARGNLPPGLHVATWSEIAERYGTTPWRRTLLEGLGRALRALDAAGCRRAYIDGSFVTAKEAPADFDACWEAAGVDAQALDPVLLDFSNRRAAQKAAYRGELFPADTAAEPSGTRFLDYFQRDPRTGDAKGILAVDLAELP